MSSQPIVSGGVYTSVIGTGAGTTVVSASDCDLKRVFWGGSYVGTMIIYDSATAAGTSVSNRLLTVGIPLLRYPESVEMNVHCKNGIVAEATGTPLMTLVWDR